MSSLKHSAAGVLLILLANHAATLAVYAQSTDDISNGGNPLTSPADKGWLTLTTSWRPHPTTRGVCTPDVPSARAADITPFTYEPVIPRLPFIRPEWVVSARHSCVETAATGSPSVCVGLWINVSDLWAYPDDLSFSHGMYGPLAEDAAVNMPECPTRWASVPGDLPPGNHWMIYEFHSKHIRRVWECRDPDQPAPAHP